MNVRTFPNLTRLVSEHGGSDAVKEWEELLDIATTNFSSCNDSFQAINELAERISDESNKAQIISAVCTWLYSKTSESCFCGAPKFITGCDNAYWNDKLHKDECMGCKECPWVEHTGVFK